MSEAGLAGIGDQAKQISRAVSAVHKDVFGRGPDFAATHVLSDCVLVLLWGGHTRTEESIEQAGGHLSVASSRVESTEMLLRERMTAGVEAELDRKIVAFMSSSHQDPSVISYVFVFDRAGGGTD